MKRLGLLLCCLLGLGAEVGDHHRLTIEQQWDQAPGQADPTWTMSVRLDDGLGAERQSSHHWSDRVPRQMGEQAGFRKFCRTLGIHDRVAVTGPVGLLNLLQRHGFELVHVNALEQSRERGLYTDLLLRQVAPLPRAVPEVGRGAGPSLGR